MPRGAKINTLLSRQKEGSGNKTDSTGGMLSTFTVCNEVLIKCHWITQGDLDRYVLTSH